MSSKIKEYCDLLIRQSIEGLENESPKIDFKSKWYNLKEGSEIQEFLKDTTSIVNTVGLDGYLIIGFNDKTKELRSCSFAESGLRDTSDLPGIIIKKCSDLFELNYYEFEFERNTIGIIHLPPCLNKPIFIKNWKKYDKNGSIKYELDHRVFVRKGTSTFPASKYDFELMYYDRKNIEPDYSYSLDIISLEHKEGRDLKMHNPQYKPENSTALFMTIENHGKRNLIIKEAEITLSNSNRSIRYHEVTFQHNGKIIKSGGSSVCSFEVGKSSEFWLKGFDNKLDEILKIEDFESIDIIFTLSNNKKLAHSFNIEQFLKNE